MSRSISTRLLSALAAAAALFAAASLLPPYLHGWGCRPTPASVALVLVWLLPLLGGVRVLLWGPRVERFVLPASAILAGLACALAIQGGVAQTIMAQACR